MIPPDPHAPLVHGGDLDAARTLFPGAPEPFLDLSTGINPNPYPVPALPPEIFARLPEPAEVSRLADLAASRYGAPSGANVVPASGTQILMALIAASVPPGRAAILGPTYAEHARAASVAGHDVETVSDPDDLRDAALAVVVNPNNPDGRVMPRAMLRELAGHLSESRGLLVVDEAFLEAVPHAESLAGDVVSTNVVVIRSFGKFFGLAGLRLGFAIGREDLAARLRASLGPWPVSGPALAIGGQALADDAWIAETRNQLSEAAMRLDRLLANASFDKIGGTPLFSLVRSADAAERFAQLGRAGIFVRRFEEHPDWLRFGLPGSEADWRRLEAALAS
jgi:cobalamin biosynthesis protein CobC